jgi:hypothetical protein
VTHNAATVGRRRHRRHEDWNNAEFAKLEHVIVSLEGGRFVTPVDSTLAALGHKRNAVLSAASFLHIPEIVSRSDFVALIPEQLLGHRAKELKNLRFIP